MFIDRVYQTLQMLANTDGRGNVGPQDYILALYNVILEKYEEYLFEVTKAVNRENRGLANRGLENIPDRIREKIQFFLTSGAMPITSGQSALPGDCRYIDTVITATGARVEFKDDAGEFYHIAQFPYIAPTAAMPIALRTGTTLQILPATTPGPLKILYLRNPKIPKWTYEVVDGVELFNPGASDFQDIDMHPSEEDDIVARLLVKFGINLKEPDLQAAANNMENQEFNLQNSN
jgi:hypothetical protein